MLTLHVSGLVCEPGYLHDMLLADEPKLRGTNPATGRQRLTFEWAQDENGLVEVWLAIPDDVDPQRVADLVAQHTGVYRERQAVLDAEADLERIRLRAQSDPEFAALVRRLGLDRAPELSEAALARQARARAVGRPASAAASMGHQVAPLQPTVRSAKGVTATCLWHGVPTECDAKRMRRYEPFLALVPPAHWRLVPIVRFTDNQGGAFKDGVLELPKGQRWTGSRGFDGSLWHNVGHVVGDAEDRRLERAFVAALWDGDRPRVPLPSAYLQERLRKGEVEYVQRNHVSEAYRFTIDGTLGAISFETERWMLEHVLPAGYGERLATRRQALLTTRAEQGTGPGQDRGQPPEPGWWTGPAGRG